MKTQKSVAKKVAKKSTKRSSVATKSQRAATGKQKATIKKDEFGYRLGVGSNLIMNALKKGTTLAALKKIKPNAVNYLSAMRKKHGLVLDAKLEEKGTLKVTKFRMAEDGKVHPVA